VLRFWFGKAPGEIPGAFLLYLYTNLIIQQMKKNLLPSAEDLKQLKPGDSITYEMNGQMIRSVFKGKEKDFFCVLIDHPGLKDPLLKDKTDQVCEAEDIREIWLL
jgi:hypothetical protein